MRQRARAPGRVGATTVTVESPQCMDKYGKQSPAQVRLAPRLSEAWALDSCSGILCPQKLCMQHELSMPGVPKSFPEALSHLQLLNVRTNFSTREAAE